MTRKIEHLSSIWMVTLSESLILRYAQKLIFRLWLFLFNEPQDNLNSHYPVQYLMHCWNKRKFQNLMRDIFDKVPRYVLKIVLFDSRPCWWRFKVMNSEVLIPPQRLDRANLRSQIWSLVMLLFTENNSLLWKLMWHNILYFNKNLHNWLEVVDSFQQLNCQNHFFSLTKPIIF